MAESIRPKDLPPAVSAPADAAIIIDNGTVVQKATPAQLAETARPFANQSEAEAGADNAKTMTPLRTKQAIDSQIIGKAMAAAIGRPGDATNMGTTPGTILSDNGTAKQWFQELEGSSAAKATALGIADAATDMGAGFGKLIPNNPSVSAALHALEDAAIRVGLRVPVTEYPNGSVGALATRVAGGDGRVGNITYGSPDEYITTEAPVRLQQLFTDVQADMDLTLPNRVNWIANEAIVTVVGENANAMIAGVFSEISTYAVNNREIAGVVGFAKALADRDPSGSGSGGDMWGMWAIAANNGHLAHAIGIEVNVMNQYAHWYDHGDPTGYDPDHYTYGVHIFPDWSTKTNTRALSIRPRNDGAGWSTGILTTGYTDVGIFVDSLQAYRDPGDNLLPASPVGLVFGPNTSRKIAIQRYVGGVPNIHWELGREGQFLVWRRSGGFWWQSFDADNNLLNLVNGNARFTADGSFRFSGSLSISSYAVVTANNGGTLALTATQPAVTLDPPGTIASYTVTLPSSPENGQEVSIGCTQTITAFTLNGGTVANAPTTFPAATTMRFKFSTSKNAWYRN